MNDINELLTACRSASGPILISTQSANPSGALRDKVVDVRTAEALVFTCFSLPEREILTFVKRVCSIPALCANVEVVLDDATVVTFFKNMTIALVKAVSDHVRPLSVGVIFCELLCASPEIGCSFLASQLRFLPKEYCVEVLRRCSMLRSSMRWRLHRALQSNRDTKTLVECSNKQDDMDSFRELMRDLPLFCRHENAEDYVWQFIIDATTAGRSQEVQTLIVNPLLDWWASSESTVSCTDEEDGRVANLLTRLLMVLPSVPSPSPWLAADVKAASNNSMAIVAATDALLNGVGHRLGSSSAAVRRDGALVAVAHSRLRMPQQPLILEEFPNILEEWLLSRRNLVAEWPAHSRDMLRHQSSKMSNLTGRFLSFVQFPLDPQIQIALQPAATISKVPPEGRLDVLQQPFMNPFGITDVSPAGFGDDAVTTLMGAFHDVTGIGAMPNEAEHERAKAVLRGLTALPSLLRHHRESQHQSQHPRPRNIVVFSGDRENELYSKRAESSSQTTLASLAGPLTLALVCHDNFHNAADHAKAATLRSASLIELIKSCPLQTMHQLSSMLFHANYSVSQRVFMYRAVQSAVKAMSNHASNDGSPNEEIKMVERRLYPPMHEKESAVLENARRVVADRVEKATRRWGRANRNQSNPSQKVNLLDDYAESFISALLQFYDEKERSEPSGKMTLHSFSFFAEADMLFGPAELVRTIECVLTHIQSSHLKFLLSMRALPFLECGVRHAHPTVRAQTYSSVSTIAHEVWQWCFQTHEIVPKDFTDIMTRVNRASKSELNAVTSDLCKQSALHFGCVAQSMRVGQE